MCVLHERNFEGINRWQYSLEKIAKVNDTEKLARLMCNYNDGWNQTPRETPLKLIAS